MAHWTWRELLGVGVLVATLGTASTAHADAKADALAIATEAYEAQERGDLNAADRLYREAYCLDPDPTTVFNLATVARDQQRTGDAAALFQRYLEEAPGGEMAPDAKAILKTLTKVARGDDQIVCPKHVDTPPPTDVPPVEPNRHDYQTPPSEVRAAPTQATRGGTLRWVGVATTVVGLGVLGGGGYFALQAKGHSDAISNNTGPWTDELLARQQQGEDAASMAKVLFIAGGAVVVTGVVLTIVGGPSSDDGDRSDGVALAPMLTASGGGFVLAGGF